MPVQVFLDTNVFSRDPGRKSSSFSALEKLSRRGYVQIHVSTVAVREFVSQDEEHFSKTLGALHHQIKELRKREVSAVEGTIGKLERALGNLKGKLQNHADASMKAWLSRVGAQVYSVHSKHTRRALGNYFSGGAPFKSKKNRADIPDAFIFECLKDIAIQDAIHVVSSDKEFAACAARIAGATVHAALDDLVGSAQIQTLLRNANTEQNLDQLREMLPAIREHFDAAIKGLLVDSLAHETFEDRQIPSDDETATITGVDDAESIEYNAKDAIYYGDGSIGLPFEATVGVLADYAIFKSDWDSLPFRRQTHVSVRERNERYYGVEESLTLAVGGLLVVQLSDELFETTELTAEQLTDDVSEADFVVEDVEVAGIAP